MKLSTLNYIYELLKENEARTRTAMQLAYETRNQAEDEEAENLETLINLHRIARQNWLEALEAKEDFEDQEW